MDALKALAGQQGCSADGTAAQRNPMSKFVNQALGGPGQQMPQGPAGPRGHGPQGMNEVDQGMAQGMGVMQGPRGAVMGGPASAPQFVAEFEQMRQQQHQHGGPMMRGPMGHGPIHGGEQWIHDFEKMNLGGASHPGNIQMEAAFRESMKHQMPRPMGQRWAGQMAGRPRPTQMDRAWQRTEQPPPAAQQWAQEMSGPKEAPDAAKWIEEVNASEKVSLILLILIGIGLKYSLVDEKRLMQRTRTWKQHVVRQMILCE